MSFRGMKSKRQLVNEIRIPELKDFVARQMLSSSRCDSLVRLNRELFIWRNLFLHYVLSTLVLDDRYQSMAVKAYPDTGPGMRPAQLRKLGWEKNDG